MSKIPKPEIKSKAIETGRCCYRCALPITEDEIRVCPRCGSTDVDNRRARPAKFIPREKLKLPHPWSEVALENGGMVLLTGGPGSGKTSICMALEPKTVSTSEQQVDMVAAIWFRINKGKGNVPIFSACKTAEDLEMDLMQLEKGDIGIVDSISQIALGPKTGEIMRRAMGRAQAIGACIVFIAQFTKDGEMYGPNELKHLVDVVAEIPRDKSGLRRLTVEKNRYGDLSSTYFSISENGVGVQSFDWAYSVEGPPGGYELRLFPGGGTKYAGILEALRDRKKKVKGVASAAVCCSLYEEGFVEPPDGIWRRKFAEKHGLKWIGPEEAMSLLKEEEDV